MFSINDIKGVIPAMITVFDENENIDESKTRKLVNHLISKDIDGLYLVGSTGEGFLMDKEERKEYIKIVVDEVNKRVPIIVHVGMIGTKNSIELAQYSEKVGADAISSVPPFYWKFNQENIFNYYSDISASTNLPMIVYNVPMAGLLGVDFIKRLSEIENVKGVKYTALSHQDIAIIKDEVGEDFKIYSGCDEMSVSGLMNGADGIIGSFYNLMPEMFVNINNAVINKEFDKAMCIQKNAIRLIRYSLQFDYYSIIKLGLKWMGVEAGYVRRPFINYDEEKEQEIKQGFIKIKKKYQITDVDFLNAIG